MRLSSAAALCLALIASAVCATPVSAETVYGAPTCGAWLGRPSVGKKQWLLGYMSGLSIYHSQLRQAPSDPLGRSSGTAKEIYAWMDSYCRDNPLKRVDEGGSRLFEELKGLRR